MTKVSFIIPCYNIENYISFCLDSVINQDYKNIEIICVNDGSTDKTEQILRSYQKFDNRIKVINQENKGQAAARNLGLEHVSGDYLHFLDGDDYVSPLLASKTLELALKFDTDIVFFNYLLYNMKTKIFSAFSSTITDSGKENKLLHRYELSNNDILNAGTTTCYRLYNTDFIKNNNIKFIEGMNYEDAPFSIEALCRADKTAFSNLPLYIYRINRPDSIMTSGADTKYLDAVKSLNIRDSILKDFCVYERYKGIYLHLDISFLFLLYNRIGHHLKKEFYEILKNYFSTINFDEYKLYQNNYAEQYYQVKCVMLSEFEDFCKGQRK